MSATIHTLGELRQRHGSQPRTVKEEIRDNLVRKLQAGEPLFPGIIGYDDTVIPQLVNAILSRHNFILLGLRGQAKTRILRASSILLDEEIPVIPGLRDPRRPAGAALRRVPRARRGEGDPLPIAWLPREDALRREAGHAGRDHCRHGRRHRSDQGGAGGLNLADELTMHYGLLPRANRGIFAINELPDLAGQDPGRPVQHPAGRRRPD